MKTSSDLKESRLIAVSSCHHSACIPVFHPEYGRYMLESTPGEPYGATLDDLMLVEGNMRFRFVADWISTVFASLADVEVHVCLNRRKLAQSRMKPHEVPLTLTSFPRLGAPGVFTDPYHKPGGGVARSLFLPDEVINQHVRFPFVLNFVHSLVSHRN